MLEDGVWRTIRGHKIFIKNGQSLSEAIKERENFKLVKEKNELKKVMEEIDNIHKRLKEIQDSTDYFFGDKKLREEEDDLLKRLRAKQLERLDIEASINKDYIQDKDLRDFVYDYTRGDYQSTCRYTEEINNGKSESEAFEYVKKYAPEDYITHRELNDEEIKQKIQNAKKLQEEIKAQPYKENTLIRFEKAQYIEDDPRHQYEVGEEFNWGIKSTSSDENYFEKVVSGNDKIEATSFKSAYPYVYTEYKIVGSRSLDISKYSEYPDQKEALVQGRFKVLKVDNFEPKIVYDEKNISFKDYLKEHNYSYIERVTKTKKDFITIYDKDKKKVFDIGKDNFVEHTKLALNYGDDEYVYPNNQSLSISKYKEITYDDIISGKVPYRIKRTENKEKSTYGTARQIVIIKQIDK